MSIKVVLKTICILFFLRTSLIFSQGTNKSTVLTSKIEKRLDSVLYHYQNTGEKEKYKAAQFLIENISHHKSIDIQWIDENKNEVPFSEFEFSDFNAAFAHIKKLKDSIKLRPTKHIIFDKEVISSELLIENIDLAFLEWKNNEWSKDYSFEVFCDYILPYRNLVEPLEKWRRKCKKLGSDLKYKPEDITDPVEVCTSVVSSLDDFTFINKRPDPIPILSPSQMLFRRQGSCPDLANFAVLVCRSMGIATTFDFTPHYAASSNRHFWNTVIDTKGNHIPFNSNAVNNSDESLPYVYNANKKRLGKVFRVKYSINKESLAAIIPKEDIPESFLEMNNIIDVTAEYVAVSDLQIDKGVFQDSIAYLNVFNLGRWKVIDWGKTKSNKISFENLGRDLVYLPSTYVNKKKEYLKYPFLVNKNGDWTELKPDSTKTFSATLSRGNELINKYIDNNSLEILTDKKYRLSYWDGGWKEIGVSKANTEGVFFENIPRKALFLLTPINPDRFERIFTIQPKTNKIFWY